MQRREQKTLFPVYIIIVFPIFRFILLRKCNAIISEFENNR